MRIKKHAFIPVAELGGGAGVSTRRMGTDTVKYLAEIFKGINLTQLAAGDKAVNDIQT